ncbi:hypothetical protein [Mycoplasma todarodis]|uniref:Phosphoribosyltransferase domain-containing protein n=1 Tax=Mycoplasma todarodis TaxID=1937191 RepID=A0A4R0XQV1_9MOLU|nr:hypothetical protein [Mycoplasma todarodis]TCG11265.1 hypothetical protein C4B25_02010 [Mycoplasma todarodis]
MVENKNWELTPTKNPLNWKDGEPTDICNSWYMVWYQAPWKFGYFNALKSNKEMQHTKDLKENFIDLLKWRVDLLKKTGQNPVIVLPPRKSTWNQTMLFAVEALEDVEFIKIKSPDYRGVHFLVDRDERERTIQSVYPKWKVKFNPTVLELKNVHYIFIDDYYTTGVTTKAVLNIIQENVRLPETNLENGEFTNFEAIYISRTQNKRNAKSKNMWVVDPSLSEKVNKYAKETKFTSSMRDSSFYKKQ